MAKGTSPVQQALSPSRASGSPENPNADQPAEGPHPEKVTSSLAARAKQKPMRSFSLDLDAMKRQGFFVPSDKPERLALELRAIKRRLLLRLKFHKLSRRRKSSAGEQGERPKNLVMVTSTRPDEGKTFSSVNLAMSLAVEDKIGTILIDADALRPSIHGHFGLPVGPGFTDIIAQRQEDLNFRSCLLREQNYPLALLTSGDARDRSAQLYAESKTELFLKELSARFPDRLIILDAPPVLATPEAAILANYVDEVIFVVAANETPEPAVASALDELLDVNDRVSLVLNKCLLADDMVHYVSYNEYYGQSDKS